MSFVVFSCRSCGVGVEVQPDNLLTICAYCGAIYPSSDLGDVPVYIVPSVTEDAVRQAVRDRMATDKQMRKVRIEIERAEGVYVPLFISRATAQGRWKGYKKEKQGDRTVKRWKDGIINEEGDFPVLGRKHAHEFGLSSLGQVIFSQQPVPFSAVEWADITLPVLAVDVDEPHVDLAIHDDLNDRIGERIKSTHSLTAITEYQSTVHILDRFIVLYPLWTVTYIWRRGSYQVAVGGGNPTVLAATEPVFLARRLWHLGLGGAGVVGVGALWCIGLLILYSGSDDAGKALLGVGVAMLASFWLAWRTARKLVAHVNIERIGHTGEVLR